MDFETEFTVKYPCKNQQDSDRVSYFVSEKTLRDSWFNLEKVDDYSDESYWK